MTSEKDGLEVTRGLLFSLPLGEERSASAARSRWNPANGDPSTAPWMPDREPAAVYCQNVQLFQPPGSGVLGPPLR